MAELVEKARIDPEVARELTLAPANQRAGVSGECVMHERLAGLEGMTELRMDEFKNYVNMITKIALLDPKMDALPNDFFVRLPNLRSLTVAAGRKKSLSRKILKIYIKSLPFYKHC